MSQENQDEIDSDRETQLSRFGVRIPPFYPEDPELWFCQLECIFALANITSDSTKFHHAISQLRPTYTAEVDDIITASAAPDKYERLKTELVKKLSALTEKTRMQQLLTDEELGDRKPSAFLRHLKHLAGPNMPEIFLRTIWTSRLPSSMQPIIASQYKATLEEVAEMADRINDFLPKQVASTPLPGSVDLMADQISALTKQLQELKTQVERLSRPRNRRRSRSRGRSLSRRSNSNYRRFPTCWYHHKFGDKSNKCVKPCDY